MNRGQEKSALYMQLQLLESARADGFSAGKANVKKMKDALTQAIRVIMHMCRSGLDFDAFRQGESIVFRIYM